MMGQLWRYSAGEAEKAGDAMAERIDGLERALEARNEQAAAEERSLQEQVLAAHDQLDEAATRLKDAEAKAAGELQAVKVCDLCLVNRSNSRAIVVWPYEAH
jgi:hypothetical protein